MKESYLDLMIEVLDVIYSKKWSKKDLAQKIGYENFRSAKSHLNSIGYHEDSIVFNIKAEQSLPEFLRKSAGITISIIKERNITLLLKELSKDNSSINTGGSAIHNLTSDQILSLIKIMERAFGKMDLFFSDDINQVLLKKHWRSLPIIQKIKVLSSKYEFEEHGDLLFSKIISELLEFLSTECSQSFLFEFKSNISMLIFEAYDRELVKLSEIITSMEGLTDEVFDINQIISMFSINNLKDDDLAYLFHRESKKILKELNVEANKPKAIRPQLYSRNSFRKVKFEPTISIEEMLKKKGQKCREAVLFRILMVFFAKSLKKKILEKAKNIMLSKDDYIKNIFNSISIITLNDTRQSSLTSSFIVQSMMERMSSHRSSNQLYIRLLSNAASRGYFSEFLSQCNLIYGDMYLITGDLNWIDHSVKKMFFSKIQLINDQNWGFLSIEEKNSAAIVAEIVNYRFQFNPAKNLQDKKREAMSYSKKISKLEIENRRGLDFISSILNDREIERSISEENRKNLNKALAIADISISHGEINIPLDIIFNPERNSERQSFLTKNIGPIPFGYHVGFVNPYFLSYISDGQNVELKDAVFKTTLANNEVKGIYVSCKNKMVIFGKIGIKAFVDEISSTSFKEIIVFPNSVEFAHTIYEGFDNFISSINALKTSYTLKINNDAFIKDISYFSNVYNPNELKFHKYEIDSVDKFHLEVDGLTVFSEPLSTLLSRATIDNLRLYSSKINLL